MLIVIDTNILVNALKSANPTARSNRLLDDVFEGIHTMCVSSAILDEYRDVLFRPQLKISKSVISEVLHWIEENAYHIEPKPTTQAEIEMKDEDDRIFYDVAKCVNARLITRNHKDYPVHELVTLIDELY